MLALWACSPDGGGSTPMERPEIVSIATPTPVLDGSLLLVTGVRFDELSHPSSLVVRGSGVSVTLVEEGVEDDGAIAFAATPELVGGLDEGTHSLEAVVRGGGVESAPHAFEIEIARSVPLSFDAAPMGNRYRNDLALISGDGFLEPGEGTVEARFRGTFTADDGSSVPVDVALPVLPAERFSRTRGIVRLTTGIGGIWPGTFDGSVTLDQRLRGGGSSTSRTIDTTIRFLPPELFAVEPTEAALEQIVIVRGAGFLGGEEEDDEATLIRLEGTFAPSGGSAQAFGPAELVLQWISGSEVRGVMTSERRGEELVSTLFDARRGTFTGMATPVVIKGIEELAGSPVPFMFTLGPTRQVIWLRFLPGFYDSLPLFGLGAAAGDIEERVRDRIQSIYDDWLIDVRLEEPTDFSANGYAITEIGGPDPNGVGLFGYDNTPGKDIGNVRLADKIGGANAETLEDGNPGYGGVFVESFLFFSSHPELPMTGGGPEPDPLFDEIFDPVRARPATLAEVRGEGDAIRVSQVARAVHALASLIGETSAHEIGHSLGLADPYGPSTVYHNDTDEEGCLMDSGGSRPFGERADEPGYAPTHLCHDAPGYLDSILGP